MAQIHPFRGWRYNCERLGDLAPVLAPPFDLINAVEATRLLARHPHNAVQLIWTVDQTRAAPVEDHSRPQTWLGKSRHGPYIDAARQLHRWIDNGTLVRDPAPMLYAYSQTCPGTASGAGETQFGFLAAVRLDADTAVIRCHEETPVGQVSDRLALLRAVRGNLRPVFGFYSDPSHAILNRLRGAVAEARREEWTDGDGQTHTLWPISDPAVISAVMAALADRPLVVAGDQSDYEAARLHQRECQVPAAALGPEERLLVYLTEAEDPGTRAAPVQWLLNGLDAAALAQLLEVVRSQATVERLLDAGAVVPALAEGAIGSPVFGLITREESYLISAAPEDDERLIGTADPGAPAECAAEICERLMLRIGLGWEPAAAAASGQLTYAADWRQALAAVRMGHYSAACLLPSVDRKQLLARAPGARRLPAGSTCFLPRIPTGLVFRLFDETPG